MIRYMCVFELSGHILWDVCRVRKEPDELKDN